MNKTTFLISLIENELKIIEDDITNIELNDFYLVQKLDNNKYKILNLDNPITYNKALEYKDVIDKEFNNELVIEIISSNEVEYFK